MGSFSHLPLMSAEGQPLPHTFYRQDSAPRGLLIVLPGLHYGPDGPLNYHVVHGLRAEGWDTLGLTYGFQAAVKSGYAENWIPMLEECRQAIRTAVDHRPYPIVAVVGKSLGSSVLSALAIEMEELAAARLAHHTPPLGMPSIDDNLAASRQAMYLALGTVDNFYDPDRLADLRARRPMLIRVVEGADHGMDVPGDLEATLRAVRQVVEDTLSFALTGAVPELAGPAS